MNPTQPMSNFMGRHPALPPTNNLLQLPNNSGKRKIKLMRSLSKSKIPSDSQQEFKPDDAPEISEKEHNIPQSPIRDTLMGDDKLTYKDIWEGSSTVMSILGCIQDILPKLPNVEPYGVRVNFPNLPEFTGSLVKKYSVSTKDTVNDLLQQIGNRFQVNMSQYRLTTLNGIPLSSSSSFLSLGIGTLFHTWELSLTPSSSQVDVKVVEPNNGGLPVVDLNAQYPMEHSGLKVLAGLVFPSGSVEFGSRLRGMQKLDLFVPIGRMFADLCRHRYEISDVSRFTLATMDGTTLHPDCVLADYGLGVRFSSWDLRVQRKSDSSAAPMLHQRQLMWLFVPEAWAPSASRPSPSPDIIEAVGILDTKCTNVEAGLERAKKEIAALNSNSDSDKNIIYDLRAQVDELVEEVHSLSASKSLFMEMSDILKQDVEAFSQEKDMWKKEKERLQSYFDTVVVDLEARVAQLEEENDQLKRKGAAQELMAELVQLRAKYKEALEGHEKELQRVMRENLVQRRKLVQEVEDRILTISQEKGQMAMEWNRLRSEKTSQLEELRRESEKINRERFSMEHEYNIREAKLRRDFEVQLQEMRRGPRRRSSSFEADDAIHWEQKHEVEKKLDTILEEQITWRSQLTGAQQEKEKAEMELDETSKRYREETEQMRKQLEELRIEGEQQIKKLLQSHREEGDQQMEQFLQKQKEESQKQRKESDELKKDLDEALEKLKKLEEDNSKLQQQAHYNLKQAGEDQKQWVTYKEEAEKALKQVEKLKGDSERQQKQADQAHRRHRDEIENIQRELEKARDYQQRVAKEEAKQVAKQKEIDDLKRIIKEKETEVEGANQQIAGLNKQHEQTLLQLGQQHELQLSQLLQQHQQKLQQQGVDSTTQQHKFDQLMEEFKEKLESVQKQHQAQLTSADKQHEFHVSSITNKYEQQLSGTRKLYEDKLTELQRQLEGSEQQYRNELNATTERIAQLKQAEHIMEEAAKTELNGLKQTITESQLQSANELNTANLKISELENQLSNVTKQHEAKLTEYHLQQEQKQQNEKGLSDSLQSHKTEAQQYKNLLTDLQQQYTKHQELAVATETSCAKTIQELQAEKATLQARIEANTKHTEELTSKYQQQLSDLRRSHALDLTYVENSTLSQRTELTEKYQHQLAEFEVRHAEKVRALEAELSSVRSLQQQQSLNTNQQNDQNRKREQQLEDYQNTVIEMQQVKTNTLKKHESEFAQYTATISDLQTQLHESQTERQRLKLEREDLLQELKINEETKTGRSDNIIELRDQVTALTTQLAEERKRFGEDRELWHTERSSMMKDQFNQLKMESAEEPTESNSKRALKKTGSEMNLGIKKQNKYAGLHTDRTDRDRGTTAMLIAKRLCDVERMLNIKQDDEGADTACDDKESVLRVLKRIDTIRQTLARNKQTKELKSPSKEKSPSASRKNISPTKLHIGGDTLDTTTTPTTILTDHRAEFRLASDLKSAKEVNHDLTAQLGVVKRQLSDMHKHHERTLNKLKEEHTWSIDHLKRSFEKDKEVLRSQLEIEIRKQVEESLKPAWRVDN